MSNIAGYYHLYGDPLDPHYPLPPINTLVIGSVDEAHSGSLRDSYIEVPREGSTPERMGISGNYDSLTNQINFWSETHSWNPIQDLSQVHYHFEGYVYLIPPWMSDASALGGTWSGWRLGLTRDPETHNYMVTLQREGEGGWFADIGR